MTPLTQQPVGKLDSILEDKKKELDTLEKGCGKEGDGDVNDAFLICGTTWWSSLERQEIADYALKNWSKKDIEDNKKAVQYCLDCKIKIEKIKAEIAILEQAIAEMQKQRQEEIEFLRKLPLGFNNLAEKRCQERIKYLEQLNQPKEEQ